MSRHAGPFRRRGALNQWTLHFGPNMTPMVDVVMVILVFFMASAAFLGPEWFLRSLVPRAAPSPTPADQPAPPPDPLALRPVQQTITLRAGSPTRADGLGQTNLTIDAMIRAVAAFADGTAKAEIEILIRPEPAVPYSDVVRIHEGCEAAGITRVGVGVGTGKPTPP